MNVLRECCGSEVERASLCLVPSLMQKLDVSHSFPSSKLLRLPVEGKRLAEGGSTQ